MESKNLRTSRTAWGFCFCSDLLMLEVWRRRAHCSGMPCTKRPTDTIFYSEEYFMQLDIHSFLASSSFLSLLLPLAYVNNLFLNKTRTKKKKKSHPSSDFQFSRVKEYNTYADSTQRRAWNIARLTKKSYSSTTGNSWDFPWLVTVESLDQLLWKLGSSSSYTWVHQPPKNI